MLYMLLFISNVCFPSTTQTNHDFYESAINSCLLHTILQCKGDLHFFLLIPGENNFHTKIRIYICTTK